MPPDARKDAMPHEDDVRCRAAMIRLGYMSGGYIDRCPKCGAIESEGCLNRNAYHTEVEEAHDR